MTCIGRPGAGKTTILAILARDLLAQATADPAAPVPVIFNLSSWAAQQKPLAAWLAEELNRQYQVSRKLAEKWLAEGHLALLLDGLDEVAAARREACVQAINTYRDAEAAGPLVVCSRLHDYEALQARLKLGQAIVLKKLTRPQVEHFFQRLTAQQSGP
ncbi:MAG: NACHT domain-containing protein, partial [Anaerolineae bacterium]|nr:NACHT domain-containing protein [Anaerolineae bacterium]